MIIDFHTHVFPERIVERTIEKLENQGNLKAHSDGTVQGLLKSMDEAGVDMSILLPVATKPSQFKSVNEFAKSINDTYPDRLFSFGGIHPDSEDYKTELETIKELGLKGIKLHPDYQNVLFDDERYMRIIEYADKLGLIVFTHAGLDVGYPDYSNCTPVRIRHVIDTLHPKKLVLAHYGSNEDWDGVYEYLAGQDVYFDLAYMLDNISDEDFFRILNKHDSKKVLFATDSPWKGQKDFIRILKSKNLDKEVLDDIFAGNAKRLLEI